MRCLCPALLVLISLSPLSGCSSGSGHVVSLSVSPASGALSNGSQGMAYSASITATGGVSPYTIKLDPTSAALPAGLTFGAAANQGTITGTPTATGTTTGIIVDVTDSESPAVTIKATYSLTINASTAACPSGGESVLSGQYVFVVKGFDSSGNPALVGGVLNFNGVDFNGLITSGEIDMNLSSGVQTNLAVISGSYKLDGDKRGCMSITTSAGTQNYRFSAGNIFSTLATGSVVHVGHLIGFDATGPFTTGIMFRQEGGPFSTSQVTGSFAFGGSSIQNAAMCNSGICGGKVGLVGLMTFDGSGGITSGSEDVNQNGILDGDSTFTTWPATSPISFNGAGSSYSISPNGRGTLTIALAGSGATSHAILYLRSPTSALFMSSDSQSTSAIVSGLAAQQSGGPFSGSSLTGAYVGYDSGLGSMRGTTAVEVFEVNVSNPNISGTSVANNGGTFSSGPISGVTYTVAPMGRTLTAGWGGHSLVLYLVGPHTALILNSNSRVDSGEVQSQTGTSTNSNGPYALGGVDPEDPAVVDQSAAVGLTSGSASGTSDTNESGTLSANQPLGPFTYSIDSTGLGLSPSGCTISANSTNCQLIFYVISTGQIAIIGVAPGDMDESIVVGDIEMSLP